jgi:hypothetical protein
MAIQSTSKKKEEDKAKKRQEEETLKVQSAAIQKLYKGKEPIDNSKNTQH